MVNKQLSIDTWTQMRTPLTVVQHEADSRTFNIQLTTGSLPIDLTGASVVFYAIKPDNTIVFNACTIEDATKGKISYTMTGQTCAIAGNLSCWIEIVKTSTNLRTREFTITVQASEDSTEAIESTSEFTALEAALAQVAYFKSEVNKNEINNGNFDRWTMGTSFGAGVYTADRWYNISGSNGIVSRISGDTSKYGLRLTSTTDSGQHAFTQLIENPNNMLYDKPCTISIRAKASQNLTLPVLLRNSTQGISIESTNLSLTTTWQTFSHTFSASTQWINDDIIDLRIVNSVVFPLGATIDFDFVKLELGDVATIFVAKSFTEEQFDCQRNLYKITNGTGAQYLNMTGWGRDADRCRLTINTPVELRTTPTLSFNDLGGGSLTVIGNGSYIDVAPSDFAVTQLRGNQVDIEVTKIGAFTTREIYGLALSSYDLFLDAEL